MANQKQAFKVPTHLIGPPYRTNLQSLTDLFQRLPAEDLALKTLEKLSHENVICLCGLLHI